jgi:hypothetical protein
MRYGIEDEVAKPLALFIGLAMCDLFQGLRPVQSNRSEASDRLQCVFGKTGAVQP